MRQVGKKPDLRLSYSSAQDLRLCEQRWFHRKVAKTPVDNDYEEGDHFMIGKAFHHILEHTLHEKPEKMSRALKECVKHEDILLKEEYFPLVTAMVLTYCKLHEKSGLSVVCVEEEIEEEDFFTGFIDAIMEDSEGNWYVVDLKTTGSFRIDYIPPLIKNTQLSLYSAYAMTAAKEYDLDPEKFSGARYRTTLKPRLKRAGKESAGQYAKRLLGSCKSYDIHIPVEMLDLDALDEHAIVQKRAEMLIKKKDNPRRNYSNCTAFFSSCPYFSKCHDLEFTEAIEQMEILEVSND